MSIETFRKRYHKAQVLRLYSVAEDGQSLSVIAELTKGFYLGRSTDVIEGAVPYALTIEQLYNPELTEAQIGQVFMLDLVNAVTENYRRYRTRTDVVPRTDGTRYVLETVPAFSDQRVVND